jgi:hypothetical protein
MRAQELSGRRVEDRLDEPTVFPKRDRLAVRAKGKRPMRGSYPAAFALASVRPTLAICGRL